MQPRGGGPIDPMPNSLARWRTSPARSPKATWPTSSASRGSSSTARRSRRCGCRSDGVKQPFGIVHGGAFAALSETVCSIATYTAVRPRLALGQANETIFMRAVTSGTVHARARALHRGSTSWVWDVEMRDDEKRLCATSRLIIAVRDAR